MKKISFVLAVLLLVSGVTFGQFETGKSLFEKLEHQKLLDRGKKLNRNQYREYCFARGYIVGLCDALHNRSFSLPPDLAAWQAFDIVRSYLIEHSERLHEIGADLVIEALREAFPIRGEPLELSIPSPKNSGDKETAR